MTTRRKRPRWARHLRTAAVRVFWRGSETLFRLRKGAGLLRQARLAQRELVFAVGMHRTGTRSLAELLGRLGYRTHVWPWWYEDTLRRNLHKDNRAILELLDFFLYHYDAFTDVPFPALYKELEQRFPRARFILVRRDSQEWWNSVVRHWGLVRKGSRPLDPGEYLQYRAYEPADKTTIALGDKAIQIAKFEAHNGAVEEYFADKRHKFLSVELNDPDKGKRISEFLGKEAQPFGHVAPSGRRKHSASK